MNNGRFLLSVGASILFVLLGFYLINLGAANENNTVRLLGIICILFFVIMLLLSVRKYFMSGKS